VLDARDKIIVSKERLGTWAKVAQWYTDEHKKGAFHRLVNDDTFRPSIELLDAIERKPLPPELKLAECCPTCHVVHGDGLDCHGAPIAAIVVLAPGEQVTRIPKPGRERKPRHPGMHEYFSADPLERTRKLRRLLYEAQLELTQEAERGERAQRSLDTLLAAAKTPLDVSDIADAQTRQAIIEADGFWRGLILAQRKETP
jgi:hypothetical protein